MNVTLIVAVIVVSAIALLFLIALFTRRNYSIERSVLISRPVGEVFQYLRLLKNQDNYNKWVMIDPAMKKHFTGVDGSEGFIYRWDGYNKAGAGEQEIKSIVTDSSIKTEVRFSRPFKGVAKSLLETGSFDTPPDTSGTTIVKWTFSSELKYPANILLLLKLIEKTLSRDLEVSLANLKSNLEV
ncbi:SRPBCC family protein [Flavihumibacter solisilvae]|uniref:Polyketide cyclase n=1 Tax=Flavihumibacter solisilvae TaxID=1349421 RepID=A0A0C1L1W0_9BACT|nr:SRPBCC family protein [Flavihumibacter solisilvae]KIC93576.1 hypothetical protein OI18_17755 [Flavihumibacter solisilvae]